MPMLLRSIRVTTPFETECPGCGLVLPTRDGPIDPYANSSPGCWGIFGEIMAREFSGPEFFASHRLTVDAYMVQHQVQTTRASRQSLWHHLAGLYLVLECRADPGYVGRILARLAMPKRDLAGLRPPAARLSVTVVHLRDATELDAHARCACEWAAAVWDHLGGAP